MTPNATTNKNETNSQITLFDLYPEIMKLDKKPNPDNINKNKETKENKPNNDKFK